MYRSFASLEKNVPRFAKHVVNPDESSIKVPDYQREQALELGN